MQNVQYLSEAWFELNRQTTSEWSERLGVNCSANFVISEVSLDTDVLTGTDALAHKVHYYLVVQDGRLAEMGAGKLTRTDVSINYKYYDARAEIAAGDHPDLAYMSGRMKLEGDYARWIFGLRPLLDSAEYTAYRLALAQHTDF
ncbi:MAG: hypothetical protein F4138_01560 [Acidimicrobiia bacterium]|nr:hypothetical protein [Acidimicrobiia bacterium]MYC57065.1 hypothetical protein [Acidimicrobiia bacterium]MYG93672.1 hypothetical protein [Acidimicrobiia bacterium]MYI30142.1 hypothetical protein [Acidimicrobiia bacterium]